MATKLYVGGLSYSTKNEGLKDLFSTAGNVISASVIMDKFSGRSKGFGFVEMETPEEAQKAIDSFNEKEFDGRKIFVNIAREKTEGERGGDRRNGGGYRPRQNNGGSSFRFR